jgi:putative ABC transport system ATP-binding protein
LTIILESENLKRHYVMGATVVRALDGVSLSLSQGEFIGLLGTSGSGKSTLLNLIAGLDRPTEGILRIFGNNLADMTREELSVHRRKNVGMIFQSFNLISSLSALDNVALAMLFAGTPRPARDEQARILLETVGLADRSHHRPFELSGGEQQRVCIARALANGPAMLLADEPTGNLDSRTAKDILDLLQRLHSDQGKTILMVTHDAGLAARCARRRIIMSDGRVLREEQI